MSEEIDICPACGGHFNALKHKVRCECCSKGCGQRACAYRRKHGTLEGLPVKAIKGSAKWRELNDPRYGRAARLAVRDAEYAKLGVTVTVVERGGIVTENRGTVPIVSRITHKGS